MSRDSTATYLHFHSSHHADLLERFTQNEDRLSPEPISLSADLERDLPSEESIFSKNRALFGIQIATQPDKEVEWRDLGLDELMRRGPGDAAREARGPSAGTATGTAATMGMRGVPEGRREEDVVLALRRREPVPEPRTAALVAALGSGTAEGRRGEGAGAARRGGAAGGGLPR